jgi:hypothetical protein
MNLEGLICNGLLYVEMMLCVAIHRVKFSKVTDKCAWRRNRWCFTVTSPVLSSSALLSSLLGLSAALHRRACMLRRQKVIFPYR